jgi:mannose-6-phosphate isomerase-like protein (cupin superfamily)
MAESSLQKREGRNFTVAHLGGWDELDNYTFKHPRIPREYPRKLFLKDELGLTGMEVSLNKMLPGEGMPFYHAHQTNEELYVFLKGKGQFQIDGEVIDVKEGTVIRVAPDGVRAWRNNSSEELYFIVIQTRSDSFSGSNISDGKGAVAPVNWPEA